MQSHVQRRLYLIEECELTLHLISDRYLLHLRWDRHRHRPQVSDIHSFNGDAASHAMVVAIRHAPPKVVEQESLIDELICCDSG